ncbi:membrane protein [Haloactinopolyspora alba]|uniref:Membrane protein n=1 Tax=Haloactinopolyspora alba TaxID=648780 RepID=A0A2P8E5H1_9ACTN|nr:YihY/virulence factor BrkB family protein [Haloactinopolyspora alba]PSL04702.1 membrane protein [Haloactinopolyspora alba]
MITWFRRWWQRLQRVWQRLRRIWERLEPTLPVRSWQRYGDLRGDRLAGAASFYGFVSLFPLVLLAASAASAVAGQAGIETVQDLVNENLPGFGSESESGIDVSSFHRNSGTLGLISGVGLLYTGMRWVDSIRAAVRSMWLIEDKPGNIVVRKTFDLLALGGLGVLLTLSWGTSVILRRMARDLVDWFGIEGLGEAGTLEAISWVLSIGVNTLLFSYLLAGLPRIIVPARNLLLTALLGAFAFEVLKTFLVEYVVGPASNSAYAAFATPLAMLAWIYLVTRLLMLLAALTVESALDELEAEERAKGMHSERLASAERAGTDRRRARAGAGAGTPAAGAVTEGGAGAEGGMGAGGGAGAEGAAGAGEEAGGRPRPAARGPVLEPTARQARAVGMAAGTVLGAAGVGLTLLAGRAARTARAVFGPRSGD